MKAAFIYMGILYKGRGEGKVPVLFYNSTTPWRHIAECRYSSTYSLTSALDGGEWSVSHSNLFTPRERAPGTHWIGGWVGHRAGLFTHTHIHTHTWVHRPRGLRDKDKGMNERNASALLTTYAPNVGRVLVVCASYHSVKSPYMHVVSSD
jgi:hypothetical protein